MPVRGQRRCPERAVALHTGHRARDHHAFFKVAHSERARRDHAEADPVLVPVQLLDPHSDRLTFLDDVGRLGDTTLRQLGNVNQTITPYADVDEGPEFGYPLDDALHFLSHGKGLDDLARWNVESACFLPHDCDTP